MDGDHAFKTANALHDYFFKGEQVTGLIMDGGLINLCFGSKVLNGPNMVNSV